MSGCLDPHAANTEPMATVHDSQLCLYNVYGCIDALASNFDSRATVQQGSCTYSIPGCRDLGALQFATGIYGNIYIYIYTSDNLCISMHGVECSRVHRYKAQ